MSSGQVDRRWRPAADTVVDQHDHRRSATEGAALANGSQASGGEGGRTLADGCRSVRSSAASALLGAAVLVGIALTDDGAPEVITGGHLRLRVRRRVDHDALASSTEPAVASTTAPEPTTTAPTAPRRRPRATTEPDARWVLDDA